MSTYVIVDVNYTSRGPQPHIVYAGNDGTYAVETFRRMFNDIAVVNGTCPKVPTAYWPYMDKDLTKEPECVWNDPSANDVFDHMMKIFKARGYVDLNSDWLKNYDYYQDPFYIRFEKREDD